MAHVSSIGQRDATLDIARALAIIAIVVGHVLRGLVGNGLVEESSAAFQVVDRFLYSFHLPVFAFLAGLFVKRAVERDGALRYLRQRDLTFLYLYLLWTVLHTGSKLATSSLVNTPTSISALFDIWRPNDHLWFLPFLIIVTTVSALLRFWRAKLSIALTVLVALFASLAMWGVDGHVVGTQGIGLTVFYVVGVVLGVKPVQDVVGKVGPGLAWISMLGLGATLILLVTFLNATPPTTGEENRDFVTVLAGVVASTVGVAAVMMLARLMSHGFGTRVLSLIGQRTMEIFLAHITAAAGARILLDFLGVRELAVHLIVGTLAGVALPLILWWAMKQIRFPWLFQAPAALTHGPAAAATRGK